MNQVVELDIMRGGICVHKLFTLSDPLPDAIDTASSVMETQCMHVTPELANLMLDHNIHNRHVRADKVNSIAAAIAKGNFDLTHQGIAFWNNGELADGQHRLYAIIKAGKPVDILVTVGMKPTPNVDGGLNRNEADRLAMGGYDLSWVSSKVIAVKNIIFSAFPSLSLITIEETAEYLQAKQDSFVFALERYRPGRVKRLNSAAIPAAITLAHMDHCDPVRLSTAASILGSGVIPAQAYQDPSVNTILRLRSQLLAYSDTRGAGTNKYILYCTAHAISQFMKCKEKHTIRVPQKFPFKVYDTQGDVIYKP